MKVILNTNTVYENNPLSKGTEIDVELRVAERWINMGIAHLPEVKKGNVIATLEVENLKDLSEKIVKELTPEEVIFREPEIKQEIKETVKKPAKKKSK